MAGAPRGTVPLRQIVSEAAQEIGYKPKGGVSAGWQAAVDKVAGAAGQVPMANGMVKRNPAKRPAPMAGLRPTTPVEKPLIPLGVEFAKIAAKQPRGG